MNEFSNLKNWQLLSERWTKKHEKSSRKWKKRNSNERELNEKQEEEGKTFIDVLNYFFILMSNQ